MRRGSPCPGRGPPWTRRSTYRRADPPQPDKAVQNELVYLSQERGHGTRPGMAVLQLFALPMTVGVILAMIATPTAAIVGMIGAVVCMVWLWRRPSGEGTILRVNNGELCLLARQGREIAEPFPLADLLDVTLDSKTIQPVQDGGSAIPAMRFIDSKVSPEVDVARIVLVARGRDPVPLTKAHLAHMDATEWRGKIRVFLRKQQWVPEDERESA